MIILFNSKNNIVMIFINNTDLEKDLKSKIINYVQKNEIDNKHLLSIINSYLTELRIHNEITNFNIDLISDFFNIEIDMDDKKYKFSIHIKNELRKQKLNSIRNNYIYYIKRMIKL
jgi:hypothetical protein